jgi:archaellum biogenesis ATPase FlaH/5S rRNA maturation endonuclease (ribonuclease M5)
MNKEAILNVINFHDFYSKELPSFKSNDNNQAMALCFFHDDHNPSLSLNLETGFFNCFACGAKGDIFSFYQRKYAVDFKTALAELAKIAGIQPDITRREIIKTYNYVDADGGLIFQVCRFQPKDFRQRRPNASGGWILDMKGVRLIPYNLPNVVKSDTVFIVEGEKDCETLTLLGFAATTNAGGAGKWRSQYNEHFKDKKCFILPDNDRAGKEHASTVAKNLHGTASSVKVIELQGIPEKGDVTDWINQRKAAGRTAEEIKGELREIIVAAPEWQPEERKKPDLLASLLRWNDVLNLDINTEYLLEKLIPKGSITLLFGRGGVGKTSLCLQIAKAVAEGLHFGDLSTMKTPVYFIDFENPLSVLKERIENIGTTENAYIWHLSNNEPPPRLDSKERFLYKDLPVGLLIFDTLRAAQLADENNSQDMAVLLQRLKELRELGFTILLLHHTPKSNESVYKGSTAILDLCDHVLGLESVKGAEETIEFDSENLFRFGTRIKTRYEPYHVFLKFNPATKGFEFARDPDNEKIEAIQELLKEHQEGLKQKVIKGLAKEELGMTEGEIRKLLKKGEGVAWNIQKGSGKENRALIYVPKFDRMIGQHIYSYPINQSNPEVDKSLSNQTPVNKQQTLDNTELVDKIDSIYPINQSNHFTGAEGIQTNEPIFIDTESF